MDQAFAQNVLQGLSASPKHLSSKYFYDEKGDELFQQIMTLPEYYLTRCEYEILERQKETILDCLTSDNRPFQLIEFGAGDGTKTKVLLQHFLNRDAQFKYLPIDISGNVLAQLSADLKENFPGLTVVPKQGEYFEALGSLSNGGKTRKVVLFLGSNIGNFPPEDAQKFLKKMAEHLDKGDLLLIGFDLKKDPQHILKAYNDKKGVTKDFNLNLLERINRELGGDFEIRHFSHFPTYNPVTGEMKSFIISKKDQEVNIQALEKKFHFNAWEPLYTEVSQKYDLSDIENMARKSGFLSVKNLFDSNNFYVDCIWEVT